MPGGEPDLKLFLREDDEADPEARAGDLKVVEDHQPAAQRATPTVPTPVVIERRSTPAAQHPPFGRSEAIILAGRSLTLVCAVIGVFALYLFALSGISHERSQSTLLSHFRLPLAFETAPLGGNIRPGAAVAVLTIPRIGVHEVVVEGTNGGELEKGPGHLRTSPLPGQPGNSVIAGRRLTYGGPFANIGRLAAGDRIYVVTGEGRFTYDVVGHETVDPGHPDVIATTSGRNLLTLMTSNPPLIATNRLVVTAQLIGLPMPAPPGRPNVLASDELGLGSGGVSATLLLWIVLLLAGCVGTVYLYRRIGGWTTYVLTTPVLLAVAFLLFDNLARALPATL
jgi:sortase A